MTEVYVAGAAMTPFGKSAGTVSDLAGAAVRDALADAGVTPRPAPRSSCSATATPRSAGRSR